MKKSNTKKSNTKKKIIITSSLILLIILTGINYFTLTNNSTDITGRATAAFNSDYPEAMQVEIEKCYGAQNVKERKNCFFELFQSEGPTMCDIINFNKSAVPEVTDSASCYLILATTTKDYTICSAGQTTESEKDSCIFAYMVSTSDFSLCDKMPTTPTDDCYNALAVRTKDTSWCDKMPAKDIDECYNAVEPRIKDASWCDKMQAEINKDTCLEILGLVASQNS